MKIFVIESSNPMEVINGKAEYQCIETIGKLFEHQVLSFPVKSKYELEDTLNYISTIDKNFDTKRNHSEPLCIHISTHGNERGIAVGIPIIDWKKLSEFLFPVFDKKIKYPGEKIMVISACGAINQKLTNEFEIEYKQNKNFIPPKYLFVYNQNNVDWGDAIVAWTVLYRYLNKFSINNKNKIKNIIDRLSKSGIANLMYFVWNEKEKIYRYYYCEE
jgi:hypothetical protein